jgi:hypothetical protein
MRLTPSAATWHNWKKFTQVKNCLQVSISCRREQHLVEQQSCNFFLLCRKESETTLHWHNHCMRTGCTNLWHSVHWYQQFTPKVHQWSKCYWLPLGMLKPFATYCSEVKCSLSCANLEWVWTFHTISYQWGCCKWSRSNFPSCATAIKQQKFLKQKILWKFWFATKRFQKV